MGYITILRTLTMNQNFSRIEKAIALVEAGNVILMRHPTTVVHSLDEKRVYYVNFMEKTCDCQDMQYNRVIYCKHLYASMMKAGVYYIRA